MPFEVSKKAESKTNEKTNGNKYQKGQIWLTCLLKRSNGNPDLRASVNVRTKIIFKLNFNVFLVEKMLFSVKKNIPKRRMATKKTREK